MRRIHIIGRKNHGKTQLIVELVGEFNRRGLRVGTIKHTHHHHELDTPGKDSHRHSQAGAAAVGILSRSMSAVFWPTDKQQGREEDRYATFATLFADFDLVLVEGDTQTVAPKIEVWRHELGTEPIACHDHTILAVVTDSEPDCEAAIHRRSNVEGVASWILDYLSKQT